MLDFSRPLYLRLHIGIHFSAYRRFTLLFLLILDLTRHDHLFIVVIVTFTSIFRLLSSLLSRTLSFQDMLDGTILAVYFLLGDIAIGGAQSAGSTMPDKERM